MQTKSLRIRVAGLVMAGLGLFAVTAFILNLHRIHHVSSAKVAAHPGAPTQALPKSAADWAQAMRKSSLTFQANEGQTDTQVRYVAHGEGYELFLTEQEAVVTLRQPVAPSIKGVRIRGMREKLRAVKNSVVRLRLDGANQTPEVSGVNLLAAHTNYFVGRDPKNWHTNVPSYGQVKYHDVYPGVDLVFYGNQRRLEYDLIVAPGADPGKISFDINGTKNLKLDSKGNLIMSVSGGKVELQKPTIYQEHEGQRIEIAGNYVIGADRRVTVALSKYDTAQPLVIDPALDYSTFLGGSQDDTASGIAVDKNGNAYVAGTTFSTDFPTTAGAFKVAPPNSTPAVFVTEVNPTGTAPLVNSTYLSGSGGDSANGIAIDGTGNIYVTGQSLSTDFPTTTNAFIQGPLGANNGGTAFLTVLNGNSLVYSTYLGGTAGDEGWGVAADANGQAYVTGQAFPSAFTIPGTAGTFPSPPPNPIGSAFLARLDTTKSGSASLIYYTFLAGTGLGVGNPGGTVAELGDGVAVDSNQNAYVTGFTTSSDFPTTANGYIQAPFAGAANAVVFVSEINTATTGTPSLVYSGYIAGSNAKQNLGDFGFGIALGPNNVSYVDGSTDSADFPNTAGALQSSLTSTFGTAFVAVINTAASGANSLEYSTFFGGTTAETATGIAADSTGNAYVSGVTQSTDLPFTPGALQTTLMNPNGEGFVLKLNPNPAGTASANKIYATYLGGSGDGANADLVQGIAIDTNNNAYVTGQTVSTNFPHTAGVVFPSLNGPSDAFVTELGLVGTLSATPNPLAFGTQLLNTSTTAMTVTLMNNSSGTLTIPFTVMGANASDFMATSGAAMGCTATLAAGASCTIDVVFTPTLLPAGPEAGTLQIGTAPNIFTVSLTGTGSATADFSLTVPTMANLTSGVAGSIPITVNGIGGLTDPVTLSCTANTMNVSSCTVSPTSVAPGAMATAMVTATVSVVAPPPTIKTPPSASVRQVVFLILGISMLFMIPMTQRFRTRLGMAVAMLVFVAVAGCSGSPSSHTTSGSITITGTGTGAAAGITHSSMVNLTISK
jgi:Beta-propeller repeat